MPTNTQLAQVAKRKPGRLPNKGSKAHEAKSIQKTKKNKS